jgi:hypothetical protein
MQEKFSDLYFYLNSLLAPLMNYLKFYGTLFPTLAQTKNFP